jgi:hypothetical protein
VCPYGAVYQKKQEGISILRKFFSFLGKFLTVVFAFLFFITCTLVLIIFGPYRLLLQSSIYKDALTDLDAYNKIPSIASDYLPTIVKTSSCLENQANCGKFPDENGIPPFVIKPTPENWQVLLEIFLPPGEIHTLTESTIDRLFEFINGDTGQIGISLVGLKNNLSGTAGEQGIQRFLHSLPPCSETQIAQLDVLDQSIIDIPICQPSDENLNLLMSNDDFDWVKPADQIEKGTSLTWLVAIIYQQLEPNINKIPDGVNISLPPETLADIRFGIRLLAWLPALPLLFLLITLLLGANSINNGFRLLGILVFFSSLLPLCIGLAFRFGARTIPELVPGLVITTKLTSELVLFFCQLGEFFIFQLSGWVYYPALSLFLIGLLAWIGSALISKRTGKSLTGSPDTSSETARL